MFVDGGMRRGWAKVLLSFSSCLYQSLARDGELKVMAVSNQGIEKWILNYWDWLDSRQDLYL